MPSSTRRSLVRGLAVATLLALAVPVTVSAHADLTSSDPAEGATIPSPFTGPIVLTFSEPLADGSQADLVGPDGSVVGAAAVDAKAATMTFTPTSALPSGAYQARWTSIAGDGDLLRGIVTFSVAAAATPTPEPSPTPAPSSVSTIEPATPGPTVTTTAGQPTPRPAATDDNGDGGNDAIVPIVVVLVIVAAGALFLVRRRRPS